MPLIPRRRVGRLGIFLGGRACARTLAVALTLARGPGSPPARAAEGLYLTWNDCAAGAGVPSLTGGCGSNAGDQRLYLAFTLGAPLDEVLGIEAVVDLQAGTTALPDWWHFEPANPGLGQPAGCRFGSLSASQDYTGHAASGTPWLNRGTPLVQGYTPGDPRGGTARARIKRARPGRGGGSWARGARAPRPSRGGRAGGPRPPPPSSRPPPTPRPASTSPGTRPTASPAPRPT